MHPHWLASAILTLVLACPLAQPLTAQAQGTSTAGPPDQVLLDMQQAYKRGDRKKLSALLPLAQGHVLEPWAAYWELKARLDDASAQ